MAAYQIPAKPICILFSHGAQSITKNVEQKKCIARTTVVPPNCQLAALLELGNILLGKETTILNFCKTSGIRSTILEPLFVWHSASDVEPRSAKYVEYEDTPIVKPFLNDGISPFEAPKRATGGAILGDMNFTFTFRRDPSFVKNLGLYVHMPDKTIHHFEPSVLSSGPRNTIQLSELFSFIQSQPTIWNPEVGVAIVLISCQAYGGEEEDIWMFSNLASKCDMLESLQQQANVEYQSVELMGRRELREAYPTIHFPVFSDVIDRARGATASRPNRIAQHLLNLAQESILPANISNASVNRTEIIKWGREKKLYSASLNTLKPALSASQKRILLEQWLKNNPQSPNPVLVAREAARVVAEEKAKRNAAAATRKIKANAARQRANALQLKKEKKTYLYHYGANAFTEKYGQPPPKGWLGGGTRRRSKSVRSKTRKQPK